MALRLIMVGLVAGLGMPLPSTKDLERWARGAERWMDARLAEWDGNRPADESPRVLVVDMARPASIGSGPESDPDHPFRAVQEEMVATFARESSPAEVTARPALVDRAPNEGGRPVAEGRLMATPVPLAPVHAFDSDRAFAAVVEGMAARFAAECVGSESLEVGAGLDPSEDLATNREAEGIDASAPRDDGRADPTDRGHQLTRAVRLTREAVCAWADWLQGPADVALPR